MSKQIGKDRENHEFAMSQGQGTLTSYGQSKQPEMVMSLAKATNCDLIIGKAPANCQTGE